MPKIASTLLPLALAALLLASACCSQRQLAEDPAPVQPQRVHPYRTANFTCAVAGTTVNGQIRLAEDSIIWASASKVVELGRAVATPDSVIVYAKVMGSCFRGTYDDLYRRFWALEAYGAAYNLQEMLTAPDADARLQSLARRFGVAAEVRIQPWRESKEASFPIYVPPHVKSL